MTNITNPFPYFPEAGTGGFIYVGAANLDARTNPITVYRDAALTLPWSQPIRTVDGYPAYQGAQANIYSAASTVSLTVLDSQSRVVTNGTFSTNALLSDLAATTGAALVGTASGITVQDLFNRDYTGTKRNSTTPFAYDDFLTDGALSGRTSPSGLAWTVVGGSSPAPTISSGWVSEPSQKTFYGVWNHGAAVDTHYGEFKFDATGSLPTASSNPDVKVNFTVYDGSSIPTNFKSHFTIGIRGWSWFPFVAGVPQNSGTDSVGTKTQGFWQLVPGASYSVITQILTSTTVRIRVLSDTRLVMLDRTFDMSGVAGYSAIGTNYTFIETIPSGLSTDTYAYIGKVGRVAVGKRADPGVDVSALLRGTGFLEQKYGGSFTATSNGFYPIAEGFDQAGSAPVFLGSGDIHISLEASNGAYESRVIRPNVRPLTSPLIDCSFPETKATFSTVMGSVRVGHNGAAYSRIDIELPTATSFPVKVTWWTEGYLRPYPVPTVPATISALANSSLFSPPAIPLAPLTFTVASAAQNDWFRVAVGNGWQGFALDGEFLMVAQTANGVYGTVAKFFAGGRSTQGLVLKELYCHHVSFGGAVTQARISRDSAGASNATGIVLDLFIPTLSSDCTVTLYPMTGADKLAWVNPPTGTATALTTENSVIQFGAQTMLPGVTTNGDVAATLRVLAQGASGNGSTVTQRWNTPLTADRAVTLSTTYARTGARFRIIRTAAATGAFNLNVGTGPLKALPVGSWCDVEYDGSAWFLAAYGTL
jgi:hypothetical protein